MNSKIFNKFFRKLKKKFIKKFIKYIKYFINFFIIKFLKVKKLIQFKIKTDNLNFISFYFKLYNFFTFKNLTILFFKIFS